MSDHLTYWRCPTCEGEGEGITFPGGPVVKCPECRGSGNALKPAPRSGPIMLDRRCR